MKKPFFLTLLALCLFLAIPGMTAADTAEIEKYQQAAEQGDAGAQFILGLMYATGQGVQKDYQQAVKWYRQAAEQGFAEAQSNLGVMYKNGQGVPQDYKEAIKWWERAAGQGIADAQFKLGMMNETPESEQQWLAFRGPKKPINGSNIYASPSIF